jgi:hypothetical protein
MELLHQSGKTGLQCILIRDLGSERDSAERELQDAGILLPLWHRAVWAEHISRWDHWFLLVRDANGRACGGLAVEKVMTRALPGHAILRVRKFGAGMPDDVCRVALDALAILARKGPRILRLQVNVFSRGRTEAIGKILGELGFLEVRPPSTYSHTLVIDLKPSEDEIFASFSTNARRRIRETMKMSLKAQVITDPIYAERLTALQQEAFQRTGGDNASEDWTDILKISEKHPDCSRVAGLFEGDEFSPEKMDAFLWGCNHGDHWQYRAAGSARSGEVRIPYGYQLTWDMIRFAKAAGAEWFDMGGITLSEGNDSALEGISRFKRYFGREVAEVGAEWILEPAPMRAKLAAAISSGSQRLRALKKKKA